MIFLTVGQIEVSIIVARKFKGADGKYFSNKIIAVNMVFVGGAKEKRHKV